MKEITLETIIVYPIKAFAGIRVSQARILPQSMGLENDRQWALERANGTWVNGKTEKKIHQLDARIQLAPLRVKYAAPLVRGNIFYQEIKNSWRSPSANSSAIASDW
jgi:uncharacterized protein YcbX